MAPGLYPFPNVSNGRARPDFQPPNHLHPPNFFVPDYPGTQREESRGIRVTGGEDPGHSTPRREGPLGHINADSV